MPGHLMLIWLKKCICIKTWYASGFAVVDQPTVFQTELPHDLSAMLKKP